MVAHPKTSSTHAHRTHISKCFLHAHAHVRPHIAHVRARTHLCNPCLANCREPLVLLGFMLFHIAGRICFFFRGTYIIRRPVRLCKFSADWHIAVLLLLIPGGKGTFLACSMYSFLLHQDYSLNIFLLRGLMVRLCKLRDTFAS